MKHLIIIAALFSALALTACEEKTNVVNVPVPGPAGPTGATGKTGDEGAQGAEGNKGEAGSSSETTVIVAPAN